MLRSIPKILLPLALLGVLSACSWADDMFTDTPQANAPDEAKLAELNRFPFEKMAPDSPPPPQAEMPTPRPTPGDEFAWRPGHWEYVDGLGFQWHGGYWIRKPAFTAVWKPDFWTHHTYGWALTPGHWE